MFLVQDLTTLEEMERKMGNVQTRKTSGERGTAPLPQGTYRYSTSDYF